MTTREENTQEVQTGTHDGVDLSLVAVLAGL